MKKFISLLLACGFYINSLSQIEVSPGTIAESQAKWTIAQAKGIKKGMGRLNLNFPAGTYWSVNIYKNGKFQINRSIETYKLKHDDMAPGIYSFMLNTVLVGNVEIKEGHITTLRSGILEINSNDWELRSEDGKKFLTSGNRPAKMALPTGFYQLVQGSDKSTIEVKEYGLSDPGFNYIPPSGLFEITPLNSPTPNNTGKLFRHWPLDTGSGVRIYQTLNTPYGPYEMGSFWVQTNIIPLEIPAGNQKKIAFNNVLLRVPIKNDSLTRIKSGYLHINSAAFHSWKLFDTLGNLIIENGRNLIALPAVRFVLIVYETSYLSSVKNISIQIKDGEILPIGNPREEIMTRRDSLSEQWRINLVDLKTATGRVKVVIPPSIDWTLEILNTLDRPVGSISRKNNKEHYDLKPGIYNLKLNSLPVLQVPVLAGRETVIRTGVLKLRGSFAWELKNANKTRTILTGNKSVTIALPAGLYQIKIGTEFYPLTISEGLTEEL